MPGGGLPSRKLASTSLILLSSVKPANPSWTPTTLYLHMAQGAHYCAD